MTENTQMLLLFIAPFVPFGAVMFLVYLVG